MIEKFEFDSCVVGKSLLILAAVHGNETAGTNALKRLLQEINEKKIVLTMVSWLLCQFVIRRHISVMYGRLRKT